MTQIFASDDDAARADEPDDYQHRDVPDGDFQVPGGVTLTRGSRPSQEGQTP
jgi:hypothetical protein